MTKYKQIFNPLSKIGFDKVNQEAQIDAALDENSENAVQNKVVTAAISGKRCTTGAEQCRFDSGMPIRAYSRRSCTQTKNVRVRSLKPCNPVKTARVSPAFGETLVC